MSADRLTARKLPLSPQVASERARCAALATHLADSVLESLGEVDDDGAKWWLRRMVWELTVLTGVVREGGDAADLERRLAAQTNT